MMVQCVSKSDSISVSLLADFQIRDVLEAHIAQEICYICSRNFTIDCHYTEVLGIEF